MKTTIKIGDESFTLVGDKPFNDRWTTHRTLFEAYGKPSTRKQRVWLYWCKWFDEYCDVESIGVASRNTNFFTIHAIAYVPELDDIYEFNIKPSRNEITRLV